MQVRNNWLSEDLYKLGLQQSKLLFPESPSDILHDTLLNLQERINRGKLDPKDITKNLLFISIRNRMYNIKVQEQSRGKKLESITEELKYLSELEYSTTFDEKMSSVSRVYEELNEDMKSFFLQRFVNRGTKKAVMQKFRLTSEQFIEIEETLKELIRQNYIKSKDVL
jgi:hypothetical protein